MVAAESPERFRINANENQVCIVLCKTARLAVKNKPIGTSGIGCSSYRKTRYNAAKFCGGRYARLSSGNPPIREQVQGSSICRRGSIGRAADLSLKFEKKMQKEGNKIELACMMALVEAGCRVSIPFGDDAPYDIICDYNHQLIKIQVKTSHPDEEKTKIIFSCRSTSRNRTGTKNKRYDNRDVDFFATWWNNKCYLIPRNECSVRKSLYLYDEGNPNFIEQYCISKQLSNIER